MLLDWVGGIAVRYQGRSLAALKLRGLPLPLFSLSRCGSVRKDKRNLLYLSVLVRLNHFMSILGFPVICFCFHSIPVISQSSLTLFRRSFDLAAILKPTIAYLSYHDKSLSHGHYRTQADNLVQFSKAQSRYGCDEAVSNLRIHA